MNNKYSILLFCDDLLSDYPIDQLIAEKIPELPKAKVVSRTFGRFNINAIPEILRKKMDSDRDAVLKLLYQQEPIEHKGKPYRCICNGLDVEFGRIIDLELSATQTGRILAKSTYKNKFKKTYKNYGDFLEEWEEIV